jgi:hypothetical protein
MGLGATLAPAFSGRACRMPAPTPSPCDGGRRAQALQGRAVARRQETARRNGEQQPHRYHELRKIDIPNDISPPFHFSSIVPGIEVNRTRQPFN